MALRMLASRPDPALYTLPWSLPLEEWPDDVVVPLARGLSRHVVRIVRVRGNVYAVKETQADIARREYNMLRELQRLGLPTVVAKSVVTGRKDRDGNDLNAALMTDHLTYSLPYRALFERGLAADRLPSLIDALVVLLVRLHLAGFYWGDVSLSNVLFVRDANGFAAYLVDAETGELKPELSDRLREYDLDVAYQNIYGELLDLQASESLPEAFPIDAIVERLQSRYDALWRELTEEQVFSAAEMWHIEQRIERLHDLGFDVEELDITTSEDGDTVALRPRVVELGHHRRELRTLTGLDVQDAQARRILNDISAYRATRELGDLPIEVAANRWLREIYEPIVAMRPPGAAAKLTPAQMFHEILEHRWVLSQFAGEWVKLINAAESYYEDVIQHRPDEAVTPPPED
ncbi:hypothetical protein NBCG_03320 [Nocardioidaceae bacterium Broad-1]|nr:hypothetical protein NBCG_03320 [Nocardioidaceae bacterium Broad-1]